MDSKPFFCIIVNIEQTYCELQQDTAKLDAYRLSLHCLTSLGYVSMNYPLGQLGMVIEY